MNNPVHDDTRFTALSLLYGPPDPRWGTQAAGHGVVVPLLFRIAADKCFEPENVKRVGLQRLARDYAEWYRRQEELTMIIRARKENASEDHVG